MTASLADGSEVRGTIQLEAFKLQSSVGMLDIQMKQVASITVEGGKAVVKTKDGSSFAGTLQQASWKMTTSVGVVEIATARLKCLTVAGLAPAEASPGKGTELRPPANPPKPVDVPAFEIPAEFKPQVLEAGGVFAGPLETIAGGQTLLALDATNARLIAVKTDTMTLRASAEVSAIPFRHGSQTDVPCWSLAPSGRRAFVACGKSVTVVDVEAMKTLKTFSVEQEVIDMVALGDDGFLGRTPTSTVMVSASAQAIVQSWIAGRGRLVASRDRKRVYTDQGTYAIGLEGETPKCTGILAGERTLKPMVLSDDGRWALDTDGDVFRIGRGSLCEFAKATAVPSHGAVVFLPGTKTLALLTREGSLDLRRTETFEQIRAIRIGVYGHVATPDPSGRAIYALFCTATVPPSSRYSSVTRLAGPGRIVRISIPE